MDRSDFTTDELDALDQVIQQGVETKRENNRMSDDLKEQVSSVAETLDVKAKYINRLINDEYKRQYEPSKHEAAVEDEDALSILSDKLTEHRDK